MRFAWIILAFAIIGAAMVHLRLEQASVRAQTYRLEVRRSEVRRDLWDRQIYLGRLTPPYQEDLRGRELAIELLAPGQTLDGEQIVKRE